MTDASADTLCTNNIRTLVMDGVQKANSGHPGAALSLAPLAHLLYAKYLRHNPANAAFPNRDRFVLSAGHASMLLYATLHLSGYDVSIEDLRQFRQLDSRTPGHPEFGHLPGVETTTGPLGQGAATSVGMAIAQKWLASRFNRPGHTIVDYRVYAVLGDGCMMEGVASEAASWAGHLALDNLIWFYDSNRITIEGGTDLAFSEDVAKRFEAHGWRVQHVNDIEDRAALGQAIETAQAGSGQPNLIIVRSIIARGAPTKQNTAKAHGEPLGDEEIRGAKAFYGWPYEAPFHVPDEVLTAWTEASQERGAKIEADWNKAFAEYEAAFPQLAEQWRLIQRRGLPEGWDADWPVFAPDAKGMASRASGGKVLVAAAKRIPWLVGGAADLAPSTKTLLEDTVDFQAATPEGRNMRFGIREHAMAAACNGMALSGLRPFGASFLVFADYARPAIRLSALMRQPVIYVFTHDSIGVGEDGPTHQPVEHLASLRAIPGLDVFRPGDANEVAMAWKHAIRTTDRPVLLALSRQNLPTLDRSKYASAEGVLRGGYVVADCDKTPELILIGTGSELQHCIAAAETLAAEGVAVRVVSLPCWELFDRQNEAYRASVLPPTVTARVAIEAGVAQGWEKYVGSEGAIIAMSSFGLSAPADQVMQRFGLTANGVLAAARVQLARAAR